MSRLSVGVGERRARRRRGATDEHADDPALALERQRDERPSHAGAACGASPSSAIVGRADEAERPRATRARDLGDGGASALAAASASSVASALETVRRGGRARAEARSDRLGAALDEPQRDEPDVERARDRVDDLARHLIEIDDRRHRAAGVVERDDLAHARGEALPGCP